MTHRRQPGAETSSKTICAQTAAAFHACSNRAILTPHATPGVAGQSMPTIFEGLGAKAGVGGADGLRMTPSHLGWQGLLQDTSGLTAGSLCSPHFRVQLPLLGSELWLLTLASASLCCSISPSKGLPEILGQPFLNFYWLKSPRAQVTKTVLLKEGHTGWVWVDLCVYSSLRYWVCFDYFAQSVQFSSVAQLCRSLCDPMGCSTPGLPVHHQLSELAQTHVHGVSDAIEPSLPLLSPSLPAFNPSQQQGLLQWVHSLHSTWDNLFCCGIQKLFWLFSLYLLNLHFRDVLIIWQLHYFLYVWKFSQSPKRMTGGGLVAQSCPVLVNPWTVAWQAPLSVGFSKQEYWSGLPFPSPGDLPNPEV